MTQEKVASTVSPSPSQDIIPGHAQHVECVHVFLCAQGILCIQNRDFHSVPPQSIECFEVTYALKLRVLNHALGIMDFPSKGLCLKMADEKQQQTLKSWKTKHFPSNRPSFTIFASSFSVSKWQQSGREFFWRSQSFALGCYFGLASCPTLIIKCSVVYNSSVNYLGVCFFAHKDN